MAKPRPIFADERTAAELLCLTVPEFRKAVEAGHLPRGTEITPGMLRWNTDILAQIGSGAAIEGGISW